MDVKVYKKEEVKQPSGTGYVYVPDVIDIIPELVEEEAKYKIKDNIWSLEKLKAVADVKIVNNKLIINSDNVTYKDGKLYVKVTEEVLYNATQLEDDSKDLLEQECALATIFQKGLDPLDEEDGISWSQAVLGETNVLQLMEEIQESIARVTSLVSVDFNSVTDAKGQTYLTYTLREVA